MKIQVLGSGCKSCKTLYENTQKAVGDLGIDTKVEYITDVQQIIQMGYLKSPILTVNEKAVAVGEIPSTEDIEQLLANYL